MLKTSIRETLELFKKHKLFSVTIGIGIYTLFVSLMSCFDFNTISKILFSAGILAIFLPFYLIKSLRNWINKLLTDKTIKNYELIKITLVIILITSVISVPSYCLIKPIQSYAAYVVEFLYPKAIQNIGESIVDSVKDITTGNELSDNTPNDSLKSEYIACSSSKILISTYKQDYKIDEKFLYSYFYGINELSESYEIHDILNQNIYSLYNSAETKTPENLKKKVFTIQYKEDDFLDRIKKSKKYEVNSTNWKAIVPNSDDLIEICNAREDTIGQGYHDYRFCFLLSNNYQMLGDEFLTVSEDINEPFEDYDAVLYYYCQSIDADKKALSFSKTVEEKNCCLRRISTRYQDIAYNEGIDIKTRKTASIISKQIKEDINSY